MNGSWVCYSQLGCGVILISCDRILCLISVFSGDGEIAPNFAENLMMLSFGECRNETAQHMKTGKCSFKRRKDNHITF